MGSQANAGATQTRPGGATRAQSATGFFAPGPRPPGSLHTVAADSRYASAQLDPQPASAARARRLTHETLARWDMADLTEDAEIIAAEIVANAIKAVPPGTGGLAIVYAIHATLPGLRIYAWDIGPGHPVAANRDPDAVSGRGLTIVNAVAENWGWWPTPSGGKVVYATLAATSAT
jgi:anti-sigma regulatory factor (Ser/Thr protein kinase)